MSEPSCQISNHRSFHLKCDFELRAEMTEVQVSIHIHEMMRKDDKYEFNDY